MLLGKQYSVKTLTGYLRYASHPLNMRCRKPNVFDGKTCGFGVVWWETESIVGSQAALVMCFTPRRFTGFNLISLGLVKRLLPHACC